MSISRLLLLLLHPRQQQQQDRKRMKKRWKDFSFFKRFLLVVRDGMSERESARPRVRLPFYKSSWACNPLFSTSLVHFHLLVKSLCTITITTTTTTTTSSCTRLLKFVLAGPRIRASVGVFEFTSALLCVQYTLVVCELTPFKDEMNSSITFQIGYTNDWFVSLPWWIYTQQSCRSRNRKSRKKNDGRRRSQLLRVILLFTTKTTKGDQARETRHAMKRLRTRPQRRTRQRWRYDKKNRNRNGGLV